MWVNLPALYMYLAPTIDYRLQARNKNVSFIIFESKSSSLIFKKPKHNKNGLQYYSR